MLKWLFYFSFRGTSEVSKSRFPTLQELTEFVCWYESRSVLLYEGGTTGRSGRWVVHTFLISFHFHHCSPSTALSGHRPKKRERSFAPFLLQIDSSPASPSHRSASLPWATQEGGAAVSSLCRPLSGNKHHATSLTGNPFSLNDSESILIDPSMSFGFWLSLPQCQYFCEYFFLLHATGQKVILTNPATKCWWGGWGELWKGKNRERSLPKSG